MTQEAAHKLSARPIAYIDHGTARIDLEAGDRDRAIRMVELKQSAVDTCRRIGLSISLPKSSPSDQLWIFLNEVTMGARQF